jgi:hypothetical protein
MIAIGRKFVAHVLPGVLRPLRILWNEIIGFLFISIAVIATPRLYREAMSFSGEPDQFGRLILELLFIVPMLGLGLASFWRARKIKKS